MLVVHRRAARGGGEEGPAALHGPRAQPQRRIQPEVRPAAGARARAGAPRVHGVHPDMLALRLNGRQEIDPVVGFEEQLGSLEGALELCF